MNDKLTKVILAAVAIGLWANAVVPLVRPGSARADVTDVAAELADIYLQLVVIKGDAQDMNATTLRIENVPGAPWSHVPQHKAMLSPSRNAPKSK
jgi:hypothetical protein